MKKKRKNKHKVKKLVAEQDYLSRRQGRFRRSASWSPNGDKYDVKKKRRNYKKEIRKYHE